MPKELFNVVQFFMDETHEYVRRNVSAEEAVKAAAHYTGSPAALLGITIEVMITDQGDQCVFRWIRGKGIVWPKKEAS